MKWAMWISGGILTVIYIAALMPASEGYGYSGHSSGRYWFSGGNSTVYHESPSARSGSTGGPKVSSRGFRGGK